MGRNHTEKRWFVHVQNEDYAKVEADIDKIHDLKTKLFQTKWGAGLKEKLVAVKDSHAFKKLEADWKVQVEYRRHKKLDVEMHDMYDAVMKNVVFEDLPAGFETGAIYVHVFKFLTLGDQVMHGDLQGAIAYVLDG